MTRRLTQVVFTAALTLFLAAAGQAADLKDPNAVIKKSWEKINSLKSYSYTVNGEGWEKNLDDIKKRTQTVSSEATSKFGDKAKKASGEAVGGDTSKPKYMKYQTKIEFMKPYLMQMNVVFSDYVPKVIYGSMMTYRPDQDPNVFWFKLRLSPMALKRDITSESGNLLYASMNMQFIQMEHLGMDTKPVLLPSEKVDGKDAYVVAFVFKKGKNAKVHPVNFAKFGIPKEVQFAVTKESKYFPEHPASKVLYFFDKQTMWLVASEHYDTDGKKNYRKTWVDITENNLSEKDF